MRGTANALAWLVRAPLLGLLRFYRVAISPARAPACRYEPTCSAYAEEAVRRFGACHGLYLALRRLLRCHPFAAGGLDPVPVRGPKPSATAQE